MVVERIRTQEEIEECGVLLTGIKENRVVRVSPVPRVGL